MATANQTLEALLARSRARYVTAFLQDCEKFKTQSSSYVSERVDLNADGTIRREEVLNLPSRVAIFDTKSQSEVPLAHRAPVRFEPYCQSGKGPLDLLIKPFAWNALEVSCVLSDDVPFLPFRNWYLEWFQTRRMSESPLITGALHRMAGPNRKGNASHFVINLGTAPIDAFVDLVDVLADIGARDVVCCDANSDAMIR